MLPGHATALTDPASATSFDPWSLYARMYHSRLFEEAVAQLWQEGLISGEMHLGTGEEAIIAGVVSQLRPDDALALDHRGTAAFLMHGVDPVLLLREMLGRPDGLCGGQGGHMHLYSRDHLAASSGIVGAAGPTAAGFALAGQYLRPGTIAAGFFGEGSLNQGMLMESLNLAAAWRLPVLFVCKDDDWAITTRPGGSISGSIEERVRGLGVRYMQTDGLDVEAVWRAAREAIEKLRAGDGPVFLHASCVHLEAHFLGFIPVRVIRDPLGELPRLLKPILGSMIRPGGGSIRQRLAGFRELISVLWATLQDERCSPDNDPLHRVRSRLSAEPSRLAALEEGVKVQVEAAVAAALEEVQA